MTAADKATPLEHSLDFTKTFLQFPIGAASPFWMAYMGAASAGAAFWWISQMSRYTHLEADMAKDVVVETIEAVVEVQAAEPLVEPMPAEAEVAVVAEAVDLATPVELAVPDAVIEKPAPTVAAKAAAPRTVRAKAAPTKTAPKPKTVN